MKNILLKIEYIGTNYCGWQTQSNGLSVQQILENALSRLTGEEIKLYGSGRTDAGVHAFCQMANFKTTSNIPSEIYNKALLGFLPSDISVVESCEVGLDFHARFNAKSKTYRYLILNRESPSAFYADRAYWHSGKLDIEAMKDGALHFLGTHDFKGFMASGSDVSDTVRTISHIKVEMETDLISITIKGTGFLYNMVRIIAGTLFECGKGRIDSVNIPNIIESKDRRKAGRTLPAHGLYLMDVSYNDYIEN